MKPIFSALLFTFIVYLNGIETSSKKKEKLEARKAAWHESGFIENERQRREAEAEENFSMLIRKTIRDGPPVVHDKEALDRIRKQERNAARRLRYALNKDSDAELEKRERKAAEKAARKAAWEEERAKNPFKNVLKKLNIHNSPFASDNEVSGFGTSKATLRPLATNSNFQHMSDSAPHLQHTHDMNNMLAPFQTTQDQSEGYASGAHTIDYSQFPQPLPHNGANSLPLFEETVSHHVAGNTYVDNEGYTHQMPNHPPQPLLNIGGNPHALYDNAMGYYPPGSTYVDNQGFHHQVPYHPSALTGNHGYDNLHEPHGLIPLNGPASLPPFPQNFDSNHLLQSSGVISPSSSFSQQQGFQNLPSDNYYPSQLHMDNGLHEYMRKKYPEKTGGFGYPFQK